MRIALVPLACCLALSANAVGASTVAVSVRGGEFFVFEVPVQPNGDVRSERLELIACDGSVLVASAACDGSVMPVEQITLDLSFSRNPGTTLGVQTIGSSLVYDIAVAFVNFAPGLGAVADLTIQGQFEMERQREGAGPGFGGGDIVLLGWPEYPVLPEHLIGGRFGPTDPAAIRHGSGSYVLPDDPEMLLTQVSGDLLEGTATMSFAQVLCPPAGCDPYIHALVAFRVENPGGAERRVRVTSQMTWNPGVATVIPLPAAGWLLLGGLALLAGLRRRAA